MGCMGAQPTEKKAARTPLTMTMAQSNPANDTSQEPGVQEKDAPRIDGGALSIFLCQET